MACRKHPTLLGHITTHLSYSGLIIEFTLHLSLQIEITDQAHCGWTESEPCITDEEYHKINITSIRVAQGIADSVFFKFWTHSTKRLIWSFYSVIFACLGESAMHMIGFISGYDSKENRDEQNSYFPHHYNTWNMESKCIKVALACVYIVQHVIHFTFCGIVYLELLHNYVTNHL